MNRYVLAIAILSTLYTGLQALRQAHELSTGKYYITRSTTTIIDFFGDQVGIGFHSISVSLEITNSGVGLCMCSFSSFCLVDLEFSIWNLEGGKTKCVTIVCR